MSSLATTLSDSVVITKRNLIKVKRVPDLIVFATLSPIMFVVLFRYVFGGAIGGLPPGISYAEFLLPGIFAQTVVFGSTTTGASIAEDLQKGLIDRFRSLPMSRSAVLVGRTVADAASTASTSRSRTAPARFGPTNSSRGSVSAPSSDTSYWPSTREDM